MPPSFDRPAIQVRRTKISERIRKLQELVPNMDKVLLLPCPALSRYALLPPISAVGDRTVFFSSVSKFCLPPCELSCEDHSGLN